MGNHKKPCGIRWRLHRLRVRLNRHLFSHGLCARSFWNRRLHLHFGHRAAWLGYELFNGEGVTWLHVGWAHPRKHAWWAVSVYFYFRTEDDTRLFSRFPLWRHLPSTGWHSLGDAWMPLRPWKGGLAEAKRRAA